MSGAVATEQSDQRREPAELTLNDVNGPKIDGMTPWENLNPWVKWRSLHMVAGAVKDKLNAPSPAEWAHFALHHVMVVCSEDSPKVLLKLLEYLNVRTVTTCDKQVTPEQAGVKLERIKFGEGYSYGGQQYSEGKDALVIPRKGLVLFMGCTPKDLAWGDVCMLPVDAPWLLEGIDELYARVGLPTPVTQAIRTRIILGE